MEKSFNYEVNNPYSSAHMRIFGVQTPSPNIIRHHETVDRFTVAVGSAHDLNPTPLLVHHPKYVLGIDLLEKWKQLTDNHPDRRRIIYEGHDYFADGITDMASAIANGNGEPGMLQFFARENGIPAVSAEPPITEELRRAFHRPDTAFEQRNGMEVSTFFGVRFVPWIKATHGTDHDITNYFKRYTAVCAEVNIDSFKEGFREIFGSDFAEDDFLDQYSPMIEQCRTVIESYRDPELLKSIHSPKLAELAHIAANVQDCRTRSFGSAILKAAFGAETSPWITYGPGISYNARHDYGYAPELSESVFAGFGLPHVSRIGHAILRSGRPISPLSRQLPPKYQLAASEHAKTTPNDAPDRRIGLGTLLLPQPPFRYPSVENALDHATKNPEPDYTLYDDSAEVAVVAR